MNSYDALFLRELRAKIHEEVSRKQEAILGGVLPDIGSYKAATEYLKALTHALEWCEEIADRLSGRDERK